MTDTPTTDPRHAAPDTDRTPSHVPERTPARPNLVPLAPTTGTYTTADADDDDGRWLPGVF